MKEKEILPRLEEKLGITELNAMQKKMMAQASEKTDIILISPTGSGKTVGFILPVLKNLKPSTGRVQCVVIAPSRELVIQIAEIFNKLAVGFKVSALYGGHKVEDETNSLKITPDIIVSTPGRLLDHINRRNIDVLPVRILVLDEFDKTLELGFEDDVKKILKRLKNVSRNILTSATSMDILPEYLSLKNPVEINCTFDSNKLRKRLMVNEVKTEGKDKLESLLVLLKNLVAREGLQRCIIFVNHRESAERVYEFLRKHGVDSALYHGALDQRQRETALTLFNNGTKPVLVATDLAARGLDIKNVRNIIHYHQALTPETYTHRNGRTARVNESGNVFILIGPDENIKDFTETDREFFLDPTIDADMNSDKATLVLNGGKKEKISKGDILGFLTKECGLPGDEVGQITIFDHYSLFTVPSGRKDEIIEKSRSARIKGSKRRISAA